MALISCIKEKVIDKTYDSKLYGTWTNGFRNYTFYEDGSYNLVFTDTSELLSIGFESLNLEYDSISGDFYNIEGKSVIVFEAKVARKADDTGELISINSNEEVTDYTFSDLNNILILSTATTQIEYIKNLE